MGYYFLDIQYRLDILFIHIILSYLSSLSLRMAGKEVLEESEGGTGRPVSSLTMANIGQYGLPYLLCVQKVLCR